MENLVSVVIPTYNWDHTIERSIASIQKQAYSKIEILIVENGEQMIRRR